MMANFPVLLGYVLLVLLALIAIFFPFRRLWVRPGHKQKGGRINLWRVVASGWILLLAGGPAILSLPGSTAPLMAMPLLYLVTAILITTGTVGLCGRRMSGLTLVIASVALTMGQLVVVGTIFLLCRGWNELPKILGG
jgi:hypothetical protein